MSAVAEAPTDSVCLEPMSTVELSPTVTVLVMPMVVSCLPPRKNVSLSPPKAAFTFTFPIVLPHGRAEVEG